MADEGTIPKQVPLTLDSEILEEATTTSINDQPGMLGGTVQSVSIPSATEANSSGTEIHRVDVTSSDDTALSNGASGSTADASHGVCGEQEDEPHPTEDDPSNSLIAPRYETDVPIRTPPRYGIRFPIKVVDYETYEPPPPPRPSWIQCVCCCFLTTYYIHYARKIRNYKYMSWVRIALLCIPVSAFYYGITDIPCPFAPLSPFLLTLSAVLGIGLFFARALVIADRTGGTRFGEGPPKKAAIGCTILLLLLMTIEMMTFYTMYPNFDNPRDPFYCDKTFYYYVYYMNFVVMLTGILALLLHIPMKPSDPVQVVPLEYLETI